MAFMWVSIVLRLQVEISNEHKSWSEDEQDWLGSGICTLAGFVTWHIRPHGIIPYCDGNELMTLGRGGPRIHPLMHGPLLIRFILNMDEIITQPALRGYTRIDPNPRWRLDQTWFKPVVIIASEIEYCLPIRPKSHCFELIHIWSYHMWLNYAVSASDTREKP